MQVSTADGIVMDDEHDWIVFYTSTSELFGAVGVWLGYPLADPIVGLLITLAIFGIVIQSGNQSLHACSTGADA